MFPVSFIFMYNVVVPISHIYISFMYIVILVSRNFIVFIYISFPKRRSYFHVFAKF